MKDIHNDITPLIVKLKYSYQRIRPNQLAYMLQMRLYPYKSNFSDTPSYPSGHTIQAKVYCEVLSNKYPQYHHQLISLADDIANSRLYMGVHYPSDNKFGKYVSDLILNHPEFKTKYLK
jgi:membrane-associated phospholipid phosphatase